MLVGIIQTAEKKQTRFKNYPVAFNGKVERNAAERLVKRHTIYSSVLGFLLAQIPGGVDCVAHVANNTWMVNRIAKKVYNLPKGYIDEFTKKSALNAAGVKLLTSPVGFVPALGNVVNSAVAAIITRTVGQNFVNVCEKEGRVIPLRLAFKEQLDKLTLKSIKKEPAIKLPEDLSA